MRLEVLKSKKVIIAISIMLISIVLGLLIYFNWINRKEEISTRPININDTIEENLNEENTENNQIEEMPEDIIEENIESNQEKSNSTQQNTNSNINKTTTTNTMPYYIKVNYGAQVVTVYKKDENGAYTIPVKAMVCSTGDSTPTSGVYTIPRRWKWGTLFGNVYGQYCIEITGNILFHTVPYLRKGDPSSLEYWEYDKLGTAASAGCIRLTVADVIWLYNNCANGTKVEFYSSSDPGPLGKPSAKKISSYPDYLRNWDPTDPNANNPWKTYKEPVKQDTSSNQINNTTQDNATNGIVNNDKTDNNATNNNTDSSTNNTTTNNNSVNNSVVNNNTSTSDNVINDMTNNNQVKDDTSNNKVEQLNDNKQENI